MRYQKIHSQIWHDEKFRQFTPEAQRLFLYLMSSPHSNSIGLYVVPKMYICADLQMTLPQLKKPFKELIDNGLIMYDDSVNLLLIINHLKHNKIENELQAKGASKIVAILPKSKLYQEVIIQLPKHYHKPLVKALRELYAIPEEKEKEKTEEETETEEELKTKEYTLYGEFKNVRLSEDEYEKLSEKYNGNFNGVIETMSQHIASKKKDPYTGVTHYPAILKNDHWLLEKTKKDKGGVW